MKQKSAASYTIKILISNNLVPQQLLIMIKLYLIKSMMGYHLTIAGSVRSSEYNLTSPILSTHKLSNSFTCLN